MARLQQLPSVDAWAFWGAALWRAAAPCVAVTLILSAWTFYSADLNGSADARPADLESTVFAAVEQPGEIR